MSSTERRSIEDFKEARLRAVEQSLLSWARDGPHPAFAPALLKKHSVVPSDPDDRVSDVIVLSILESYIQSVVCKMLDYEARGLVYEELVDGLDALFSADYLRDKRDRIREVAEDYHLQWAPGETFVGQYRDEEAMWQTKRRWLWEMGAERVRKSKEASESDPVD